MQRTYAAAAFAFAAFAAWGSLYPFELRPVGFDETLARFVAAWHTGPASWSRSDVLSNILLFVPIGLFTAAAVERSRNAVAAIVTTVAGACLFSVALELAQASVLWRTSSIVDVIAETLGAIGGVLIWLATADRLDEAVGGAQALVQRASPVDRALLIYAGLFAIAWLAPFDFTLRPGEIADKFAHKRLLLPFMASPDAFPASLLTSIAVAAFPLGAVAARLSGRLRLSVPQSMLIVLIGLIALEAAQALVFSRTTDVRGMLAAIAGALAGAAAARRRGSTVLGF